MRLLRGFIIFPTLFRTLQLSVTRIDPHNRDSQDTGANQKRCNSRYQFQPATAEAVNKVARTQNERQSGTMTQDNQDSQLPICIDLTAFSKLMETRDEKLGPLLRKTKLTQACHADIKSAHSSIMAFHHWMNSDVSAFTDEQSLAIQSALLTKAVILYARATHGGADKGGRGSVQIKDKLPDELKAEHDLIIDLRNRAIVHSHVGKAIGDKVWEEQQLLLVENGDGYKPMYTTRATQMDYTAIASLHNLLSFALEFYHRRFVEQSDLIVTRMHEAGFTEEELLAFSIDPRPYFASDANFQQALDQMPK